MLKEVIRLKICLKKSTTRVDFFKTPTRLSKPPWEDLENTPTITINSPRTSYSNNQDEQHGFNSSGNRSKRAEYLAFKLNRLRDKVGIYNSYTLFLEKCITENVIPNGLKLDLQPTIGNHDEEFLTRWYGKLQTFSKEFMKDIVNFCKTTISKLANEIKETKNELKQFLEKETYEEIKETINTNQKYSRPSTQTMETKEIPPIKV